MKTFITIAICLFSLRCFSQTKLISFRSHSGSNANFHTAVERDMFDIGNSNFGLYYTYVRTIDSVILTGKDEMLVFVKIDTYLYPDKKHKERTRYGKEKFSRLDASNFFTAPNIDSLKSEIRRRYDYHTTLTDSTVFIGFNKQFKQSKSTKKQPKRS